LILSLAASGKFELDYC